MALVVFGKRFWGISTDKKRREAGQVFPPPRYSPFGESDQPDGGRLIGRVLAYLMKPRKREKSYSDFQKND